jgi:predicted transcriptional regulator
LEEIIVTDPQHRQLGRRERQIMEVVYRLGRASVSDVRAEIPDPPSYSAVRAMLGSLQDKGYLRHERLGLKYLYVPALDTEDVSTSELKHTVKTFFGGSPERAVAALLKMSDTKLAAKDRQYLLRMIKKAQQEGR